MSSKNLTDNLSTGQPKGRAHNSVLHTLAIILTVIVLMLASAGIGLRWHLGRSLAALDGEVPVAGLAAPVIIERDAQGVPTIRGAHRVDVARGLGFLHGQERFFQMDLIRRQAAGELAELVGEAALPLDRRHRLHRFRARGQEIVTASSEFDRRLLEAYVEGVNAGLNALEAPPFEYTVLRTEPVPWRPEDCMLVVYSMYLDLQGNGGLREVSHGIAHDVLPPELYALLAPRGTSWDAPLDDTLFDEPPLPTPEEFNLRDQPPEELNAARRGPLPARERREPPANDWAIGSNNWAVAGTHTAHGGALLANDMHLGHDVPNIWYRASLVFPDPDGSGQERRVTGVTLPGAMLVVAGSNGEVAWGFTNSFGDWTDLVEIEIDPEDPDSYLTPEGPRRFERRLEELRAGDTVETLEILETIWGPVWDSDHHGRQRALRWVAHDRRATNLMLHHLETVSTIDEAIRVANLAGTPAQNFVTADRDGRIGWTIMGPMPRRYGHDGRLPSSWADGRRGWDGWLTPEETPRIVDPESGRIWTANARVVGGEMYELLGDGGYDNGARSRQIRDRLFALADADEGDLLAIQLDDRALFLERWRDLLLEILTPQTIAEDPRRQEMRRLVEEDWSGHASIDSAGYRLVRGFRLRVFQQIFESLTGAASEADERFRYFRLDQEEGPLWRLVSERPQHLLDPRFDDWQEQFIAAVDAILDNLLEDGGNLADKTWGARNRVTVRHPLSRFLPFAGRWLDMPGAMLPGDSHMPRVQANRHGASERIVVSPGREEEGIFHMPTGQSGHPLSPNYRDGHQAWMKGQATPFLPGETAHTLTLTPEAPSLLD